MMRVIEASVHVSAECGRCGSRADAVVPLPGDWGGWVRGAELFMHCPRGCEDKPAEETSEPGPYPLTEGRQR